ncbi:hypothetical protein KCG48_01925 [Proteiniclasticum sp. BAD-10]|uniref:Uncharacterized protein n=1 Tax=Proteiniclasticum sediminis TaxID=2804028 RepID=A0A941CLY1_9CLOT|nr:hypothetical protein [Proteiniclasticum sediminis]MBR0575090.1 hypothetical protein [Proteiniclasticum sediminis]
MKVNLSMPNPALISIIRNPHQVITLDANFLIKPDRTVRRKNDFLFSTFQEIWLDPIFRSFSSLAVYESVWDEIIPGPSKNYIRMKHENIPSELIIHRDTELSPSEMALRNTIEERISPRTLYNSFLDNADDRGEVKTLCYLAVKGLLYFAAHDSNALQLIEKSKEWATGLDNIQAIRMYELMYYLFHQGEVQKENMKFLYKYRYHLTEYEKKENLPWNDFYQAMDRIYSSYFD